MTEKSRRSYRHHCGADPDKGMSRQTLAALLVKVREVSDQENAKSKTCKKTFNMKISQCEALFTIRTSITANRQSRIVVLQFQIINLGTEITAHECVRRIRNGHPIFQSPNSQIAMSISNQKSEIDNSILDREKR
jgi:hypothetical protein